jgi:hypothetical protein
MDLLESARFFDHIPGSLKAVVERFNVGYAAFEPNRDAYVPYARYLYGITDQANLHNLRLMEGAFSMASVAVSKPMFVESPYANSISFRTAAAANSKGDMISGLLAFGYMMGIKQLATIMGRKSMQMVKNKHARGLQAIELNVE